MFKQLFLSSLALFVISCGGGGSDSTPTTSVTPRGSTTVEISENPDPDFPSDFQIVLAISTASEDRRELEITWTDVPEGFEYKICAFDTSESKNCRFIRGNESASLRNSLNTAPFSTVVSLQLGSEITLEELLNDDIFVLFEESTTSPFDNAFLIPITSEFINGLVQYIKASNTESSDEFGFSVAISEDGKTLAVGSRYQDVRALNSEGVTTFIDNAGAVYIFTDDAQIDENTQSSDERNGWQQKAIVRHPYPDISDEFGKYISLNADGTLLAVSVPGDDASDDTLSVVTGQDEDDNDILASKNDADDVGGILIFNRENDDASEWSSSPAMLKSNLVTQAANEVAADDTSTALTDLANMQFGRNFMLMSKDGTTIAVSHYSGIEGSVADKNERVEIFTSSDSTTWTYSQTLQSQTPDEDDFFGYGLAFDQTANLLGVSATLTDSINALNSANNTLEDSGSVYVFIKNGTSYEVSRYVKPDSPIALQSFGSDLEFSSDGSVLVVGAQGSKNVYVFDASGDDWLQRYQITSPSSETEDGFGNNLALNNDATRLMISTTDNYNALGINGEILSSGFLSIGGVYVFQLTSSEALEEAYLKPLAINISFAMFGASVASNKTIIDAETNYNSIEINGEGRVLVVGTPGDVSDAIGVNGDPDVRELSDAGAVYIYYF